MLNGLILALAALAADPTDAQSATRSGETDIIPTYFHGTWDVSAASCRDEDSNTGLVISRTRIEGYEFDHKVLKSAGFVYSSRPDGSGAHWTEFLTASRSSARVGTSKVILSRVGESLYMLAYNGEEEPSDAEQFKYAHVRCTKP